MDRLPLLGGFGDLTSLSPLGVVLNPEGILHPVPFVRSIRLICYRPVRQIHSDKARRTSLKLSAIRAAVQPASARYWRMDDRKLRG